MPVQKHRLILPKISAILTAWCLAVTALIVMTVPAVAAAPAATKGDGSLRVQFPRGEKTGPSVSLSGARNEYLNFSIHLEGVEPHSLRLRVEGKQQPPWPFQFFQVVAAPQEGSGGFAPDALLPLSSGAVPGAGGVQVWVNLKIPPEASPGMYTWTVIAADSSGTLRIPLNIQVWRFSLPDDLPVGVLARVHHGDFMSKSGATRPEQQEQWLRAFIKNLREYKINGLYGFHPFPVNKLQPGTRVEDFAGFHQMLRYVLTDANYRTFLVPWLPGAKKIDQPNSDFAARARTYYPLFSEYLKRQGWGQRALIQVWDEPKPIDYPRVVKAYSLVKALVPEIKTLSAGGTPEPELAKGINIWVLYGKDYDPAKVAAAQKSGLEMWFYANKLYGVNNPLAHQRLLGWYLYRYDFGGLLFWGINYWPTDPWKVPAGRPDLFRRGTFVYPNPQGGAPIPTTRLEAVRQGLQDYQYFELFSRAHQQGGVPAPAYQTIKNRLDRITDNLQRLTPRVTMAELEDVRNQIGQLLDRAGQPKP